MDFQQILNKAQKEPLTKGEQDFFLKELDRQMLSIKDKDPKKYLQFLKTLNETFSELNSELKG